MLLDDSGRPQKPNRSWTRGDEALAGGFLARPGTHSRGEERSPAPPNQTKAVIQPTFNSKSGPTATGSRARGPQGRERAGG
jgi:hypothetical protein